MLCNSVVSVLAGMGIYISYEVNQFLLHYIPQFIVAFVIIAVGLRMIAGKKQEIEFDENETAQNRYDYIRNFACGIWNIVSDTYIWWCAKLYAYISSLAFDTYCSRR